MTDDTGRTDRPEPDWDDEDAVLAALGDAMAHDPHRTPPSDRIAAVRAAAARMGTDADTDTHPGQAEIVPLEPRPGRRLLLTGGIAAGIGGIAGYAVRGSAADEPEEAAGPVVEPIAFTGADTVSTKAGLVNHTWGTELLLDVEGLEPGASYDVVYRTLAGDDVPAGSLLAVGGVLMVCRFNAAALRADVRRIDLRDPDGVALLSAELPTVEA